MGHGIKILLLTLPVLISGCGSIKNEKAIYSTMSYEKEVIELKAESIEHMINNKYSFALLMYTEQCSYCEKAKENIDKATKELGFTLYQIEMYTASINYLCEKLPDYYKTNDNYPFMYIIKDGAISYKSSTKDVSDYSNMKRMLKSYSSKTNIITLAKDESYVNFKKENKSFILFTYDSSSKQENNLYSKSLLSAAINSNKNVLIIDKNTAKRPLFDLICSDYSISDGQSFDILSAVIDGQIKTTLRYTSESGSNITDFIDSYF